jgi:hypothetical protein
MKTYSANEHLPGILSAKQITKDGKKSQKTASTLDK